MSKNVDPKKLKNLLQEGLEISFKKLVKQKQANNGYLVFSENGKIKEVKASDIRL